MDTSKEYIEHPTCFFDMVDCFGDCKGCKMPEEAKEMYNRYLEEIKNKNVKVMNFENESIGEFEYNVYG